MVYEFQNIIKLILKKYLKYRSRLQYTDINKDTKNLAIESKIFSNIKEAYFYLCDSYSFRKNKSIK